MMIIHRVVVLLYLTSVTATAPHIPINNGSHLVDILCHCVFDSDDEVVLSLNASLQYNISAINESCTVSSTRSLTITSTTAGTVSITCIHQMFSNPVPTIGFLFTDTSVTISSLQITGCGSSLAPYNNITNMTQPYFTHNHSGLFVFHNSSVNITKVTINKYYGFAVIVKDPRQQVLFDGMDITFNLGIALTTSGSVTTSIGSGMILIFSANLTNINDKELQVNISSCRFFANYEQYLSTNTNNRCTPYSALFIRDQIINSASLTILMINCSIRHQLNILISNTHFNHCIGVYGGGILMSIGNSTGANVTVNRSTFVSDMPIAFNFSLCAGSAITFYGDLITAPMSFTVNHSTFNIQQSYGYLNHSTSATLVNYGPILFDIISLVKQFYILIERSKFHDNTAAVNGGCLTVTGYDSSTYNIKVNIKSVIAYSNRQELWNSFTYETGLFVFENLDVITFEGTSSHPCHFYDNYGSVIQADNSEIKFNGNIVFTNNCADYGSAVYSINSILCLSGSLNLTMINNSAQGLGGVIYIRNSFRQALPECALQLQSQMPEINVHGNTALKSGNLAHIIPLYNCYNWKPYEVVESAEYYENVFKRTLNTTDSEVQDFSTQAYDILISENKTVLAVYPGETVLVKARAIDMAHNTVWSKVLINLKCNQKILKLNDEDKIQSVEESKSGHYSNIKLTIRAWSDDYFNKLVDIVFNIPGSPRYKIMNGILKPCPPGFWLNISSGICQCDNVTTTFHRNFKFEVQGKCDITNPITISMPTHVFPWLGTPNAAANFTIAEDCPLEFCTPQTWFNTFAYNSTDESYQLFHNDTNAERLCLSNRRGISCGQCEGNHSVVFGSNECRKCSNHWLWTLLIYLLAGPVLICILYALRLTLTTGTVNGIIFFAQLSYAGLVQSVAIIDNSNKKMMLSILGMGMGFPLCFYDGMTQLWKIAMYLAVSLYLILLIIITIIISQFSSRFSRLVSRHSVQVLVTVVHLSSALLMVTLLDVAIPIRVWTQEGDKVHVYNVWAKDGSIRYLDISHGHALLFGAVVCSVLLILGPYLAILLFGKWFSKKSPTCSIYIRPVQEAVFAPYKEKYQYWFTLRLLFVLALYIFYALNMPTSIQWLRTNLITAVLLSVLLLTQAYFHPLKSKFLNATELIIIGCTAISYYTLFALAFKDYSTKLSHGILYTCIYLILVTFLCTLVYHMATITGLWKALVTCMKCFSKQSYQRISRTSPCTSGNTAAPTRNSFEDSADNVYREPLLVSLSDISEKEED